MMSDDECSVNEMLCVLYRLLEHDNDADVYDGGSNGEY